MKLTDCKIVYICPDHNNKYNNRKKHIEELLSNKIKVQNYVHFKSRTDNYPQCLTQATIDILSENLDTPLLILEDDVDWSGELEFDIPDNADAVYLGISKLAGHPTKNADEGTSSFKYFSKNQVQIVNMLSAHAIFYNSRKYKEAVIEILKNNLDFHQDVLMSRIQTKFFILANKKPIFFQSNTFNNINMEAVTHFTITDEYIHS